MKTKYRGVCRNKGCKTHRVQITWRHLDRNPHNHLGRYRDIERAAMAYDIAARILHEADAQLNFPDRQPPISLEMEILETMARLGLPTSVEEKRRMLRGR
jgi:hypothetical protein